MKKAVILFSGGLDSTTCVAIAKSQGFTPYVLSLDYGQKNKIELQQAKLIAQKMQVKEHKIISLALNELGGSSLTVESMQILDHQENSSIPSTYVPARNTIFLSIALGWAESLHAWDIFYGANSIDYAGYPDCRPDYLRAFETLANLATKAGMEGERFTIHAPLLQLNKAEIIQTGIRLGIDYGMTLSCYRPSQEGYACGNCDSCTYRKKGFADAGIEDPTTYI